MKPAVSYVPSLALTDDPEMRARAAWALAAGEKIARRARAVALVRSTLIVEVEDWLWQRNLTGFIPYLLRNLSTVLGEPLVKSLAFRPAPPKIAPQRAASHTDAHTDEASSIADPFLRSLYRQNKKQAQ